MNKLTLFCSLLLLLIFGFAGSALAFGVKELETEKIAIKFNAEVARGGYQVVSTEGLKQWMDNGTEMLIVDTMPYEASYKKAHIPGAVQMEFPIPEVTELDAAKQAELKALLGEDKDRLIVFYCGFTKCSRSHNGAMWAVKLGYSNVYRQPGGVKGWKEADYPVAKVK